MHPNWKYISAVENDQELILGVVARIKSIGALTQVIDFIIVPVSLSIVAPLHTRHAEKEERIGTKWCFRRFQVRYLKHYNSIVTNGFNIRRSHTA